MKFLLLSDSFNTMMYGGLYDTHRLIDLEPTDQLPYIGPALILQQTLSDSIHRPGSFDLRQLGEIKQSLPGIGTFIISGYSKAIKKTWDGYPGFSMQLLFGSLAEIGNGACASPPILVKGFD
jgi:hypothetical protein